MAGHSKWANTKHRKAAQDTKREKNFTKIIRELLIAAKLGGGNINTNSRLKTAVDKALLNNMTRDTLNRAIARGIGSFNDDILLKTMSYEGYGPGGIAIIVECLSNNRNRTVSEVRHVFTKNGGHLGTNGSVAYLFVKKRVISLFPGFNEDTVMKIALEAGADDIISCKDGVIDVYTTQETFGNVKNALENASLRSKFSKITMIPLSRVNLDINTASKLFQLINMLKDLDDVQEVYHNGEISKEVMVNLNDKILYLGCKMVMI